MKKSSKLFSIILAIAILLQGQITAFASTQTLSPYTNTTYTHQDRFDDYKITHGIDVSKHQGTIDFKAVKADGISFVIIRIGYRGYGDAGTLCNDINYETYINDAKAAGLKVGVYYYSQAINKTEAKEEANYVINKLNGTNLDLPVYYDVEFASYGTGRLWKAWDDGSLTKAGMTANVKTFCNAIKNAGYTHGLYSNKDFLTSKYNTSELEAEGYQIWLAHYISNTNYTGKYKIWQYSSKGSVDGISGNVDCNFRYTKSTTGLNAYFVNGETYEYANEAFMPDVEVSYGTKQLTEGEDYSLTYNNNIEIGKASVKISGINNYSGKSLTMYFYIVPPKVTGVKLTDRGTDYASLSWNTINGADGYQIKVYRGSTLRNIINTTGNAITITSLLSASNHHFKVSAYTKQNGTIYAGRDSASVYTTTIPAKPKSIKTIERKRTTVTIKWGKIGNATKYRVYLYNPDSHLYEKYKDVTSNQCKISGLTGDTRYKVKIKAFKYSDREKTTLKGEKSDYYAFYTRTKVPAVSTVKSTKEKSITLKWKKVSNVDGYYIQWSTTSDFSSNTKGVRVKGGSVTTKTVETAKSGTQYYVRVKSYNDHGDYRNYSLYSDAKPIVTK